MSTTAQKAFFASLASFARASADLLDEMSKGETAKAAEPKPAKAAEPKPAAVKTAPKEEPKVAPPKSEAPAAAPAAVTNGAEDLPTQARKAAKSYAEVYGREGLKEQLKKFTEGTLADIPAEKLADFIAAVS